MDNQLEVKVPQHDGQERQNHHRRRQGHPPRAGEYGIRASGNPARGWLGTARATYVQWELKQLSEGVGGPNFVQLPGGGWLAGTRRKGPPFAHTMIGRLDFARGELVPLFALPSRGDNSYPGFVVDEERGEVLVSYYSAHERKEPAIYLARLDLAALRKVVK